jgi:SIR2-like domain
MGKDELSSLIKAEGYEIAASNLVELIPNRLFQEVMEHTFAVIEIEDIVGSIKYLPELFRSTVFTTNYDNILEKVYAYSGLRFDEILLSKRIEDHPEYRRNKQRCLLKLHGDFRRPSSRVLTKNEYDECYSNKPFRSELTFIYQKSSLLFLGCSLESDRTLKILEEIAQEDQNMPRHYAFLKAPDDEDEILKREHFLIDCGVFPIWFPVSDNNYDEPIETLLVGLLERSGRL